MQTCLQKDNNRSLLLMENQKLELIIEAVKQDQGTKPNYTLKKLRPLLKAFMAYSTTADNLPPPSLIPICLFTLPPLLKKLVGLKQGDCLYEAPEKSGLKLCLQLYIKGLLRLLGECEDQIKHIVVQSMIQSAQLVHAFPVLSKKWGRALVEIWSTCTQNLNLGLRGFLCLRKMLDGGGDDFFIWGMRRMYVGYFEHCGQVNWRTLQQINFMSNCFCELGRINPEKAYYVLFGYIRSLAMQMQGLNKVKGKQKQQLIVKLYSQQTIQILRLLGQIIGQGGDQVSALTFPLCQLLGAYQRISESPEYLPLKLHIIQIELKIMQITGTYIPHILQTIIKVFKSSPLHKKHAKKAGFEGSLELGYKLSLPELKNTNVLNSIFDKTLFDFYWLCNLSFQTIGGVQIVRHMCKLLHQVEFGFSGHKKAVKQTIKIIKSDSDKLESTRASKQLRLNDKKADKYEAILHEGKMQLQARDKYRELMQERESLFRAKVIAEQEENAEEEEEEQNQEEFEDQLESGWQQASEGASEFDQAAENEQGQSLDAGEEQVSYEGDPEPEEAEEAVKEWSEHEWSSQDEVNQ